MAQLVNVIAPIYTDENRLFLQTIYYPLALFAVTPKQGSRTSHQGPTYRSRSYGDVPHLDASAAMDGSTLIVNVVNRHRDHAVETDIELEDRQFAPAVEISEINAPDIKTENSFDSTTVQTVSAPRRRKRSRCATASRPFLHDDENELT